MSGWAHTGYLQQMRGIDRATAQDDLFGDAHFLQAVSLSECDADTPASIKDKPGGQCFSLDSQIAPATCFFQKGLRG